MIGLYFAIIVVVCYLIGNVNFAKIVVKIGKKEDITKKGSGNPGTMNVLRNYGILMGAFVLLRSVPKRETNCGAAHSAHRPLHFLCA